MNRRRAGPIIFDIQESEAKSDVRVNTSEPAKQISLAERNRWEPPHWNAGPGKRHAMNLIEFMHSMLQAKVHIGWHSGCRYRGLRIGSKDPRLEQT